MGAPLATVAHTRSTGQISHNNAELRILCEAAARRGVALVSATFQYPHADTPLSWHLTNEERDAVWKAYDDCGQKLSPLCDATKKVTQFRVGEPVKPRCEDEFYEQPKPAAEAAKKQ